MSLTFIKNKYFLVFSIIFIVLLCLFFLVPINIFEGKIIFKVNGVVFSENAKLSLSYFIGIGASKSDLKDVLDFYLLPLGYLNIFLILFCLPLLITYRVYLFDKNKKDKKN